MSDDNVSDVIGRVIIAFEQMPVPPGPFVPEAIALLERRAAAQASRAWRRRLALGSIGLSTVASLLLVFFAMHSGPRLSAMEQLVKKLHEVKSLSYNLTTQNTFVKEGETEPTHVKRAGKAFWVEPGALFAEEKIVHVRGTPSGPDDKGELVVDLVEICPAGKPGIIIDHKAKTFSRLPVLRAEDIPTYSPLSQLRKVRERQGRFVRDLGTRTIDGKPARGYMMALDGAERGSGRDAVEVWLDPQTELPLEFGYTIKNDQGPEFFRVTDCRWNIDVDLKVFTTTPPPGYREVIPEAE